MITNIKNKKKIQVLTPKQPIFVVKIGSTYGVRGWLRAFSSIENINHIFKYQPWIINQTGYWQKILLESCKRHYKNFIIKIKNIENRESATFMINKKIAVDFSLFPLLKNGEYYWKDLIGCNVKTINGTEIGKIIDLIETGSNDVFVVQYKEKNSYCIKEILIPFLEGKVIKNINILDRIIEVDWSIIF